MMNCDNIFGFSSDRLVLTASPDLQEGFPSYDLLNIPTPSTIPGQSNTFQDHSNTVQSENRSEYVHTEENKTEKELREELCLLKNIINQMKITYLKTSDSCNIPFPEERECGDSHELIVFTNRIAEEMKLCLKKLGDLEQKLSGLAKANEEILATQEYIEDHLLLMIGRDDYAVKKKLKQLIKKLNIKEPSSKRARPSNCYSRVKKTSKHTRINPTDSPPTFKYKVINSKHFEYDKPNGLVTSIKLEKEILDTESTENSSNGKYSGIAQHLEREGGQLRGQNSKNLWDWEEENSAGGASGEEDDKSNVWVPSDSELAKTEFTEDSDDSSSNKSSETSTLDSATCGHDGQTLNKELSGPEEDAEDVTTEEIAVSGDSKIQPTQAQNNECTFCHKVFRKPCLLVYHMRTHTGEKPFQCSACDMSFARKGYLNMHMRIHTGEKPHKCKACDKKFSRPGELIVHERIHNKELQFKCDTCNASFTRRKYLRAHCLVHSGEAPYECEECGKAFRCSSSLKKHKKLKHTEMVMSPGALPVLNKSKLKVKCEICEKLVYKGGMKKHMATHTGNKPHICHLCGTSFIQKSNLDYHLKWHANEKAFKCELCDKAFIRRCDLNNHMKSHKGDKKASTFICDICGKSLASLVTLESHRSMHSGERKFKCSSCEKSFYSAKSLSEHEQHMHKKTRIHQCDYCGMVLAHATSLKSHRMRHTGEKPYKCKECGANFRKQGTLHTHMVLHTGETPFKCDDCGLRFRHRNQIYLHRFKCKKESEIDLE